MSNLQKDAVFDMLSALTSYDVSHPQHNTWNGRLSRAMQADNRQMFDVLIDEIRAHGEKKEPVVVIERSSVSGLWVCFKMLMLMLIGALAAIFMATRYGVMLPKVKVHGDL